jgi:hypothetical protein
MASRTRCSWHCFPPQASGTSTSNALSNAMSIVRQSGCRARGGMLRIPSASPGGSTSSTRCGNSRSIHVPSDLELAAAHARRLFMLCLRQFAFPRNAFMRFVCTFDAIFELAPIVRELFGHFVDPAWHIATDCGQDGHALTDVEFMRGHRAPHACVRPSALALTRIRGPGAEYTSS